MTPSAVFRYTLLNPDTGEAYDNSETMYDGSMPVLTPDGGIVTTNATHIQLLNVLQKVNVIQPLPAPMPYGTLRLVQKDNVDPSNDISEYAVLRKRIISNLTQCFLSQVTSVFGIYGNNYHRFRSHVMWPCSLKVHVQWTNNYRKELSFLLKT